IAPLVFLGLPAMKRWKRAGAAIAIVVVAVLIARVGDLALTDDDHHRWQQDLMLPDVAGALHRQHVEDPGPALAGLRVVDAAELTRHRERFDSYALTTGPSRAVEPIATDAEAAALAADWRAAIRAYPRGYIYHRVAMFRRLLGLAGRWEPVYDGFGDLELLGPLHHRAVPSDVQRGWNALVHLLARTPLFRPWLYLIAAIAAIVLARRERLLRNLALSGLVYELVLFVLAPVPDYRFSHWLVTASTIALAAYAVARKPAWRAQGSSSASAS
ncbi:MAG TPA: hypothetical protein VLT45_18625, partial [Kofleriaceae bacterium]|nr:hypothetical protein [Kofleriaceae bacterium]